MAAAVVAVSLMLMAVSAFAQEGAMSPYQDEQDGVSAGGKWMEFRSEDKMTGAKKSPLRAAGKQLFSAGPGLQAAGRDGMHQWQVSVCRL